MNPFRSRRVWLDACFIIASLLPWAALSFQEAARYSPLETLVWPWGAVAAAIQAAALIAILSMRGGGAANPGALAETNSSEDFSSPHSRPFILRIAIMLACVLGVISALIFRVHHYLRLLWQEPINPTQGDMLPLIQKALRTFFLNHQNPYGMHEIAHWELPLTFWPGLWLPYALPWNFECDIRLWTLAALLLAGLMLMTAWADAALRVRARNVWLALALMALAALGPVMLPGFREFVPQLHVAGFWLVLAAWGLAVLYRLPLLAGALFGLALLGRPFAIVLIPLYGIYLLRLWGSDRAVAVKQAIGAGVVVAVLGLPFLAWGPGDFLHGVLGGYEKALRVHTSQNPLAAHGFGFSGLMQELGLPDWKMRVAGAVQLALLAWAWRRLRSAGDLLVFSAAALFFFLYFSFIPWFYTFVGPLMLLAVAFLSEGAAPERLVLRCEVQRWVAGALTVAGGGLAAAAIIVAWQRLEPPDHHYKVNGVTEKLINTKLPLNAFDYYGWVDNLGYNYWKITNGNAYVGFPVRAPRRFVGVALTIRARTQPPPGMICRVYVNGELAGEDPVRTVGLNTIYVSLPERSLFIGTNAMRLEFRQHKRPLTKEEVMAMELDLGQLRLMSMDEWRRMGVVYFISSARRDSAQQPA